MNNDETFKLLRETLESSLTKFIGEKVNKDTEACIINAMNYNLTKLAQMSNLCVEPLPKIKLDTNLEERKVTISFYDPKTNDPISIATWFSRCAEGFYDRG